jgi:hypothetical protein
LHEQAEEGGKSVQEKASTKRSTSGKRRARGGTIDGRTLGAANDDGPSRCLNVVDCASIKSKRFCNFALLSLVAELPLTITTKALLRQKILRKWALID